MHILMICTNFRPGGIQRHVLDLTADLRSRGHQVTLAGDTGDWDSKARAGAFIPLALNGVAGVAGGGPVKRVGGLARQAMALRKAIRGHGVDVIHAHETAPTLVARAATVGRGLPIVMTYHGAAPAREGSVARIGRLCADLVISPSATSLEALIAKGLPRARARVIGLGVATPAVPDAGEVAALRARLLDGRAGPLVISLSRLQPQKGIDVMIDATARVAKDHAGVVVAVAGGGPLEAEVSAWAAQAGVTDRMRFLGPVSTVPLHLRAADVFLLTSRWENLPISIVEAFRAGLPVVATDCGGVRELVDDRVGALLPVGDAPGIAGALAELIAQPELRAVKGAAALARSAEDRFDPAAVHARFADMYRGLIARHRG